MTRPKYQEHPTYPEYKNYTALNDQPVFQKQFTQILDRIAEEDRYTQNERKKTSDVAKAVVSKLDDLCEIKPDLRFAAGMIIRGGNPTIYIGTNIMVKNNTKALKIRINNGGDVGIAAGPLLVTKMSGPNIKELDNRYRLQERRLTYPDKPVAINGLYGYNLDTALEYLSEAAKENAPGKGNIPAR